jgi:hypothetical protein
MVFKLFESHEKWTNGSILQLNAEEIEQEVIKRFSFIYKFYTFEKIFLNAVIGILFINYSNE